MSLIKCSHCGHISHNNNHCDNCGETLRLIKKGKPGGLASSRKAIKKTPTKQTLFTEAPKETGAHDGGGASIRVFFDLIGKLSLSLMWLFFGVIWVILLVKCAPLLLS